MDVTAERYDAAYYASGLGPDAYCRDGRWLAFFNGIAREVVLSLAPRRVFDAGCAMGMLVESLWDLGVEAHGVDLSSYAIAHVRPDMQPYCRVGSVTEPPEGRYDLITCIEVLEHVDPDDAQRAIAALTSATDTILFSSTPSDFNEPTHVNVRPPIAWIRAFAAHGFRVDLRFDGTFLSPHAMLLRRAERYDDGQVEELYAHHVLIRSALIEREQRLGRLGADADAAQAELAQVREEAQAASALLETARAESAQADARAAAAVARAEAQTLEAVARAEVEAARTVADAEAGAARVTASAEAERAAQVVLRGRLEDSRTELRQARAAQVAAAELLAHSESRASIAEERAALALAKLGERVPPAPVAAGDGVDERAFAELARRYAALEDRYRQVVAADIALLDAETARLSGF